MSEISDFKFNFYSLTENPGYLRLYNLNTTDKGKAIIWNSANVLTQKIICPEFVVETKMIFSNIPSEAKAGMLIVGNQYAGICIEHKNEEITIMYFESEGTGENRSEIEIERIPCNINKEIYFRFNFNNDQKGSFSYSADAETWSKETRIVSLKAGTWVGAKVGIFAIADGKTEKSGYVDFSYFNVTRIDK